MDMQQAVLKLFLGEQIKEASEECMAWRFDHDPAEASVFWQLVKGPNDRTHKLHEIHYLAPLSVAHDVEKRLQNQYQAVTPIGRTYCVAPFALGFSRVGNLDDKKSDALWNDFSKEHNFSRYIQNWTEIHEGHIQLEKFISEDKEDDFYHKIGTNDFMKERLAEFKTALQPLTQDKRNSLLSLYYLADQSEDNDIVQDGAKDYHSAGLNWGML